MSHPGRQHDRELAAARPYNIEGSQTDAGTTLSPGHVPSGLRDRHNGNKVWAYFEYLWPVSNAASATMLSLCTGRKR